MTTGKFLATKISAATALGFAVLVGILHLISPEFDPTWRFISEYALGSAGWVMSLAFWLLAVSIVALMVSLWHEAKGWFGRIGHILLAISALGMIIAGIFTTDPVTTATADMTSSGKLHALGGQLNMTPLAVLGLSLALWRNPKWRSIRAALVVLALIAVAVTIAFAGSIGAAGGKIGPEVYAGLLGRLLMLVFVAWIVLANMHILKRASSTSSHINSK